MIAFQFTGYFFKPVRSGALNTLKKGKRKKKPTGWTLWEVIRYTVVFTYRLSTRDQESVELTAGFLQALFFVCFVFHVHAAHQSFCKNKQTKKGTKESELSLLPSEAPQMPLSLLTGFVPLHLTAPQTFLCHLPLSCCCSSPFLFIYSTFPRKKHSFLAQANMTYEKNPKAAAAAAECNDSWWM